MVLAASRALPLVVALAWIVVTHAAAQDVEQGRQASATLPESNEAVLLSSRIEDAARAGDFQLAVQLIDQLRDVPGELVAAPATRTFQPMWRQVVRLVSRLPERGLEIYRQLYDADVAARYRAALDRSDVAALLRLFRVRPHASVRRDVGRDAAVRLIDAGAYADAVDVLRELLAASDSEEPELRAQLIAALRCAEARGPAERVLAELQRDVTAPGQAEWRPRVEQLARWAAADRASERDGEFAPSLRAAAAWIEPLVAPGAEAAGDDGDLAEAVDVLRRLPLLEPCVADDVLLVRARGTLWALDALTLAPRWNATELRRDAPHVPPDSALGERNSELKLSSETRLLLEHHLRHVVSAAFGMVYTIEGLTLQEDSDESFPRMAAFQAGGGEIVRPNEIVARSLATGRIEWRTAQGVSGPLSNVAFQDRPLPLGDRLVVPFQREGDLRLAVLEPATGKLERDLSIVGPPTQFGSAGGRGLLTIEGDTLFVCTGNGVIAALSANDFTWRWAAVYPSTTLQEQLGRFWWQPREPLHETGADRPIVADDLLVVAPIDSTDVIALDRFNGRERWRISRRESAYVVGAVEGGLIVGSHVLTCVDLEDPDGRPPRWRAVPLDIVGRPALRAGRLYVPTRGGIVALDGRTGKVVADEASETARAGSLSASSTPAGAAASLYATADALYAVSTSWVAKYPDVRALRASLNRSAPESAADARTAIVKGWLDLFDGNYAEGLERIEKLESKDESLVVAREKLLTQLFLELARSASGADRLAFLQRAAVRASSPAVAARLAGVIGDTLEAEGRWDEALAHYARVLVAKDAIVAADADDGQLRTADWLRAVARAREMLRKVSPADIDRFVANTIEEALAVPEPVAALWRLRLVVEDQPRRAAVDAALAQQKLWPELAVRCLPESDDELLALATRRRIHLTRWDVCVALNLQEAAKEAAEHWQRHFAASVASAAPDSPEERDAETAERIERRQQKRRGGRTAPFTREFTQYNKRWGYKNAELLLDPARPSAGGDRWVLLRNFEQRKLQLIDAARDENFPVRTCDDNVDPRGDLLPANPRVAIEHTRRTAWPVAMHQYLAAVPSKGGIRCVGLAPDNRYTAALWEHSVPGWTHPPRDFELTAVGGPRGLYFAPRADRIALLGWLDGRVWWQRDLPGVSIARVHLCGSQLVIVSEDHQVLVLDATFGGPVRRLPLDGPTPLSINVLSDRIIVWTPGTVHAFDATSLAPLWSARIDDVENRPLDVERTILVEGRPWIAYKAKGISTWQVLDAESGRAALPGNLVAGEYTAAAVQGDALLVAAYSSEEMDPDTPTNANVVVAAYDLETGRRRWRVDYRSGIPVNLTQLCGHPEFVPVLLDRASEGPVALLVGGPGTWALQLINKQSGEKSETYSIRDSFEPTPAECDPYLLVTPNRMIVQIHGNVIAFGNPPEALTP